MATSGAFNTSDYDGRYLTFSWSLSSQSVDTNSSVIEWSLKGAGLSSSAWYYAKNFKVVIAGTVVYSSASPIKLYNGTLVSSGSFTLDHDSAGNKQFLVSCEAAIYLSEVNCSGSSVYSLPQISRQATITHVSNFTDEESPIIEYINAAGDSVSDLRLILKVPGHSFMLSKAIPTTDTSYRFTLTDSERETLRSYTPNSNTLEVTFTLSTTIGGVTFTDIKAVNMVIVNANPAIGDISYKDTNAATIAITNDDTKLIQSKSRALFTINNISAQKGATLAGVYISVNSVITHEAITGYSIESQEIDYGEVDSASSISAVVTVTDSRGNSTARTVSLDMLAWSLPSALISVKRRNGYETETNLLVNAYYADLGGENTISIQYQTRETGGDYGYYYNLVDGVLTTITLDNTKTYDIHFVLSDRLGTNSYTVTVDKGLPILFIDKLKRSIGVSAFPADEESIAVAGVVKSSYGLLSFHAVGVSGSAGYARIATITITAAYADAPVEFKVFRRKDSRPATLYLSFEGESSLDPAIHGLYIDSTTGLVNFDAFATKTNSGTWDLYVKKADNYDNISVCTTCPDFMRGKARINYSENLLASKPSGATTATTF